MKRFTQMAKSVTVSRRDLEFKVQERTIALERLTKIDPLTELLNRRGMAERIEAVIGPSEALTSLRSSPLAAHYGYVKE